MTRSVLSFFVAAAIVALAACSVEQSAAPETDEPAEESPTEPGPDIGGDGDGEAVTIEEMYEKALADIDVEACEAGGGEVSRQGMLGMPRCVTPYADAGKLCSDASDCEGRCLGSDDVTDYEAAPGEVHGKCEANDSPFGCYAEVNGGVAQPMLCVD